MFEGVLMPNQDKSWVAIDGDKTHLYVRIWRIIYDINTTVGIHLRPVRLRGWNQPIALNKVNHAHFLTPLNARIIKTCSSLASGWRALIPASSPRLSRWLRAQRAGHQDGWACGWLSAAQMAHSVSGLTTRRGGTLTSGHDWIRQLSFASPPDTCGLRRETRGWWYWSLAEGVCMFLAILFESQLPLNTGSARIFIGYRFGF